MERLGGGEEELVGGGDGQAALGESGGEGADESPPLIGSFGGDDALGQEGSEIGEGRAGPERERRLPGEPRVPGRRPAATNACSSRLWWPA